MPQIHKLGLIFYCLKIGYHQKRIFLKAFLKFEKKGKTLEEVILVLILQRMFSCDFFIFEIKITEAAVLYSITYWQELVLPWSVIKAIYYPSLLFTSRVNLASVIFCGTEETVTT